MIFQQLSQQFNKLINQIQQQLKKILIILCLVLSCGFLGQGMAGATNQFSIPLANQLVNQPTNQQLAQVSPLPTLGNTPRTNPAAIRDLIDNSPTIDLIPKSYEQGLQIYFANCSTCHIALPAELLPRQSWQILLENLNQHYGATLPVISSVEVRLIWNYLGTFSRLAATEDRLPVFARDSRFFRALHPQVRFPEPAKITTCISCHPSAQEFNFRNTISTSNTPNN
ncbi:MAG: hypothetical protein HC916_19590 [Coleofasciculaceae cyanobacterium SM2_1_6]|nr:hypothetical protein [Coleofasciculaceae cyanobacterium SM2_1_6]